MEQILLKRLSGLGDPTLLLCAALALFLYFWIADERRGMSWPWAIALLACVSLVISAKLTFYVFGVNQAGPHRLRSPSGHVAIATTFYGCIAVALAARRTLASQLLIAAATLSFLLAVAISRVWLNLHTISEVAIAFAIGALGVLLFAAIFDRREIAAVTAGQIVVVFLLAAVTHNVRIDGEAIVEHLVTGIGHSRMATIGLQAQDHPQLDRSQRR